jgi:hypothetical protein
LNQSRTKQRAKWQRCINDSKQDAHGKSGTHHRLDNDASTAFKECIRENEMTQKLVPPGNHRCNLAERAIQTFKHHFISILSGVENKFPLSLWCHLIGPAKLTVNLLHQSSIALKISAYAHVHRQHDYMRKPFAPLGCAVQAHVKPDTR